MSVFCRRHVSPSAPLRRAVNTLSRVIQDKGTLCINLSGCSKRAVGHTTTVLRSLRYPFVVGRGSCGVFGHAVRRGNLGRTTTSKGGKVVSFDPLTRNVLASHCLRNVPGSDHIGASKHFLRTSRFSRGQLGDVQDLGRVTTTHNRDLTRVTLG